jgi:hypothetical protein
MAAGQSVPMPSSTPPKVASTLKAARGQNEARESASAPTPTGVRAQTATAQHFSVSESSRKKVD